MLHVSIHDKRFAPVANPHGVSGADTVFHYRTDGDLITGSYGGGRIRAGQLVGRVTSPDTIELLYHCVTTDGALMAGESRGSVSRGEDGRVRLAFDWSWLTGDRGGGQSHYVELTPETRPAMRLEHVAVWTRDLERLRAFYERYFGARAGGRYESATRAGFTSYFLAFPDGGARLELMGVPELAAPATTEGAPAPGYAHLAVSVGSRAAVEALAARLRGDGVRVVSGPRETGDGYFEAVVEDPDGNTVEITA
jgi:lactoylglutathione lyase